MIRRVDERVNRRRAGFTLLEVMIVVAIIVILVGAGGVYVWRSYEDAQKGVAKTTATQISSAAQQFKLQFQRLPENIEELFQPPDGHTPFIEQKALQDPWGNPFRYDASGPRNGGMKPDVWAVAPDGSECGNW